MSSWKDDPRSVDELLAFALATPEDPEDDSGQDPHWTAVWALQHCGSREVFDKAVALCASSDSGERELGADILGQLGSDEKPQYPFKSESVDVLIGMLKPNEDANVLYAVGVALGHLGDPRAIAHLVPLADHPNADVRYGVVLGLLWQRNDLPCKHC